MIFWIIEILGSSDHTCGTVLAFWEWANRIVFKDFNNISAHF